MYQSYSKEHPFRIEIADSTLATRETALPFTSTREEVPGEVARAPDGRYYYYRDLCDTVYAVSGYRIVPVYCFSLYKPGEVEGFIRDTEHLDKFGYGDRLNSLDNDIACNLTFLQSQDYLVVQYRKGRQVYCSLIDKRTSRIRTYRSQSVQQDDNMFPFEIVGIYKGCLVASVTNEDANRLSEDALRKVVSRLDHESLRHWNKIRESDADNPNVCLFHIKGAGNR